MISLKFPLAFAVCMSLSLISQSKREDVHFSLPAVYQTLFFSFVEISNVTCVSDGQVKHSLARENQTEFSVSVIASKCVTIDI